MCTRDWAFLVPGYTPVPSVPFPAVSGPLVCLDWAPGVRIPKVHHQCPNTPVFRMNRASSPPAPQVYWAPAQNSWQRSAGTQGVVHLGGRIRTRKHDVGDHLRTLREPKANEGFESNSLANIRRNGFALANLFVCFQSVGLDA
jgi:hypothetical protein